MGETYARLKADLYCISKVSNTAVGATSSQGFSSLFVNDHTIRLRWMMVSNVSLANTNEGGARHAVSALIAPLWRLETVLLYAPCRAGRLIATLLMATDLLSPRLAYVCPAGFHGQRRRLNDDRFGSIPLRIQTVVVSQGAVIRLSTQTHGIGFSFTLTLMPYLRFYCTTKSGDKIGMTSV